MTDTASDTANQPRIPVCDRQRIPLPQLDRTVLSERISARILEVAERAARQWSDSAPIQHFIVDDVLPASWAKAIRSAFPASRAMTLKRSLREFKYVAAQMDRYDPLLEEALYAFQTREVLGAVERITGLSALEPDRHLYAGGISLMEPGQFLNPHIDNSHDRLRQRYRVLNLLYYVSPGWSADDGANLELWPQGPRGSATTIVSKFNRLVVMLTHRRSWHSVSKNLSDKERCCVSNYFFSANPIGDSPYYHVTEFRGRPEQPLRDFALRTDNWMRTQIRTRFPQTFKNRHFYDRSDSNRKREQDATD